MNARTLTTCAALLLPLALAMAPPPAQAGWLGLADGDYAVSLQCQFSTVIACPGTLVGQISVAGDDVTAMDFSVDGLHFVGDPQEFDVSQPAYELHGANLSVQPFASLALGLVTDGQFANWVQGDRYWGYCHNFNANSCVPGTNGLWTARLLPTSVPEPSALALVLLGALAVTPHLGRRRRR